uniref:Uncharacterized protein n=1 Tax=Lepeophtheirus salmonis TaxID=72036 RepID=A0A0K2U0T5_LEPSM
MFLRRSPEGWGILIHHAIIS